MRSMWSGSVSFGLVSIPIKMYKTADNHDVGFHQHHDADMGRIKYVKVCADCGEVVDPTSIVKGADHGGEVVVVTEDELNSLKEEQSKIIEVLQFVDESEIDPVSFEASYYLAPDKTVNGYHLLTRVMSDTGRVAIVRMTMRTKTYLALLRVSHGNVLTMHTMTWPDEDREPTFAELTKEHVLKPQELAMATMLVDSMTGDFDPAGYTDTYRDRLNELIAAKAGQGEFHAKEVDLDAEQEVTDLLAALEASVQAKKAAAAPKKKPAPRKRKAA
jgi:DNA end-binding protein Ku